MQCLRKIETKMWPAGAIVRTMRESWQVLRLSVVEKQCSFRVSAIAVACVEISSGKIGGWTAR